jgi:hypothetical protein
LQEQHEKTLAQVARENGVGVETLRVWVKMGCPRFSGLGYWAFSGCCW